MPPPPPQPPSSHLTLPTPHTLLTTLLTTLSTLHPSSTASSSASAAITSAKPHLLTLHALFPHTLLPALDLLDRGLVVRLRLRLGEGEGCTSSEVVGLGGREDGGVGDESERGEVGKGDEGGEDEGGEEEERAEDERGEIEHHHPTTTSAPYHTHTRPRPHPISITPQHCNRKREREQTVYYVQSSDSRSRYGSRGSGRRIGRGKGDGLAGGAAGGGGAGGTSGRTAGGIGGIGGTGMGMGIAAPNYEVRPKAWSCSCKGFAFEAFSRGEVGVGFEDYEGFIRGEKEEEEEEEEEMMLLDEDEGADRKDGRDGNKWRWGGLMLQEHDVPLCKHLLACVLAEHWDVAADMVEEREVGREEMAGWAAGWGD